MIKACNGMLDAFKRKELLDDCTLYLGDCLDVMPHLKKFDAVIADIPYGTTQCKWDSAIPLNLMWDFIRLVTHKNTPIVLFGAEPFSSILRQSNLKQFKYDWIWHKTRATGFLNAKKQPLRGHESISVFCDGVPAYYPQKTYGHNRRVSFRSKKNQTDCYGKMAQDARYDSTERYPTTVLTFSSDNQNSSLHPTQKPLALMEYLVRTYTTIGQSVLDFAMGSGTTGVACAKLGRKFTGIEMSEHYFDIACQRIKAVQTDYSNDLLRDL